MSFWFLITLFGHAWLMFGLALVIAVVLAFNGTRAAAWRWLWLLGLAVGITIASKLAFLGWGLGIRALDFTGVSGHAMYAMAIWPMLAAVLTEGRAPTLRMTALGGAVLLALAVGWSRLKLGVHSPAEVVSGALLGGAVAAAAVGGVRAGPAWRPALLLAAVLGSALLAWRVQPALQLPHNLLVKVALAISGKAQVYDRCTAWPCS
ncbi:phosphatase PAP2 family protein [Chitiniphilus purpureus]|uniref:Phosphatase PAP2 family protein n=1 Tax=Chitiniphilus purpureus TaxID=2981137 RepID=A0ABY6DRJ1_9NEIS|nr:phosphatase PAP2 family protein [Chitiniphilus sp. CD1]UXY16990.1 phosphatase PAP2 family protein [Chitiniphilus sp. CD1]